MKIITVRLPEGYIERINELVQENNHKRNLVRYEIRAYLLRKIEINKNPKLYHFCVFCGKELHLPRKPYEHKEYNIVELRPCCACLKKYKGKSLNDLPESKIKEIEEKVRKYYNSI